MPTQLSNFVSLGKMPGMTFAATARRMSLKLLSVEVHVVELKSCEVHQNYYLG